MAGTTSILRSTRYYRHIAGTDFSMEANTSATPVAGCFYLLRGAEVLLQDKDFGLVETAYKQLCAVFWEENLASSDAALRMSSVWGLLGQNEKHRRAQEVIGTEGTDADRRRMASARERK